MRAQVERLARRWWAGELGAGGRALSVLTAPLSWAWSGAVRVREAAGARHAVRVDGLRVISVGNLAVGGTGKTPIAAWVARVLDTAGVPTCVLVGGAGEDEAILHRRWNPSVSVIAGRDRVEGAARARAEGARAVVLDDGFQHRRLARDLDVVLLSADDVYPAPVLPRGPYREPPRALERADALIITRRSASADSARSLTALLERVSPGLVRGAVHLADGPWAGLDGSSMPPRGTGALAVCGVARPDTFLAAVARRVEGDVELVRFADHHVYSRGDVRRVRDRARGRPIVITEKDAVKLDGYSDLLCDAFVLRDELRWDWGEDAVRALVQACVDVGVRR